MKLKSTGVVISILILIIMMLICHTMNFFYPKNNFEDVIKNSKNSKNSKNNKNNSNDKNSPSQTNYNEIYYTGDENEKQLCAIVDQAEIPCDIVRTCKPEPKPTPTPTPTDIEPEPTTKPTFGLDSLSNSEIAVLYKVAYEASAREVLTRELNELKESTEQQNQWNY